jgi:excisionase family DNA binding protein
MSTNVPPAPLDTAFIDRDELAQRLNLHPRTVQRMIARGELPRPCLSVGGRPRWLWSYVLEFCRQRHEHDEGLGRRRRQKQR